MDKDNRYEQEEEQTLKTRTDLKDLVKVLAQFAPFLDYFKNSHKSKDIEKCQIIIWLYLAILIRR